MDFTATRFLRDTQQSRDCLRSFRRPPEAEGTLGAQPQDQGAALRTWNTPKCSCHSTVQALPMEVSRARRQGYRCRSGSLFLTQSSICCLDSGVQNAVAVQSVNMGHSIIVLSSTGFREGMWKRLPAGAVKCLEQLRNTIERVVFGKQLNMKEHQCSGCISAPKLPSPNQEVSFKSCPGSCAQYRNPEPREPDLRL